MLVKKLMKDVGVIMNGVDFLRSVQCAKIVHPIHMNSDQIYFSLKALVLGRTGHFQKFLYTFTTWIFGNRHKKVLARFYRICLSLNYKYI